MKCSIKSQIKGGNLRLLPLRECSWSARECSRTARECSWSSNNSSSQIIFNSNTIQNVNTYVLPTWNVFLNETINSYIKCLSSLPGLATRAYNCFWRSFLCCSEKYSIWLLETKNLRFFCLFLRFCAKTVSRGTQTFAWAN